MDAETQSALPPTEHRLAYFLEVRGVYGRNRTVKRHDVKIAETPTDTPLTTADVLPAAAAELARLNVKAGTWRIVERPLERSYYRDERADGGIIALDSVTYAPFGGDRSRVLHQADCGASGHAPHLSGKDRT